MRPKALGKHGWSVVSGLLLCVTSGGFVYAAPEPNPIAVAIGNPLPNSLVAGRISISVAYNTGLSAAKITAFTLIVDDQIYNSRPFMGMSARGIDYLELDTRTLADGNHTVKVVAMGGRGSLASDTLRITIRNGVAGGPDQVAPLVSFRGLVDGDTVAGKIPLDVLAEDNGGVGFVQIFANRNLVLLSNRPPFSLQLDTAKFLDPATGMGTLRLEAWATDRSDNLGKAKPITLNVVPAIGNLTPAKPDPTKPISSGPMAPTAELKGGPDMIKTPMGATLVVPLPVRAEMPHAEMDPAVPPAATAELAGRPDGQVGLRPPGGKPALGPRMAKAVAIPVDPEFAPVGGASRNGLAPGRENVPYTLPRPNSRSADVRVDGVAPAPLRSGASSPSLGGARTAAPGVRGPGSPKAAPAAAAQVSEPAAAPVSTIDAAAVGSAVRVPAGRPETAPVTPAVAAPSLEVRINGAPAGAAGPELHGARPAQPTAVRVAPPAPTAPVKPAVVKPAVVKPVAVKPAAVVKPVPKPHGPSIQPQFTRAAQPLRMATAQTSPLIPEIDPRTPRSSDPLTQPRLSTPDMVGSVLVIPIPGANPMTSPGGPRVSMPEALTSPPAVKPSVEARATTPQLPPTTAVETKPVRIAKAAATQAPLIVVVDPKRQPDAHGKLPVEVYQLKPAGSNQVISKAPRQPALPKDRSYRVRRGETLMAVAKRFGVTEKSLLVANGIGGDVRPGSVIRVPGTFDVVLNSSRVQFDVPPRMDGGLALAPFRQIMEQAGGVVVWNADTRQIRAATDRTDVQLQIGSKEALVNQVVVVMDREAFLDQGRAIVPVKFIQKALDLKGEYDVKTGSIVLTAR